MLTAAFIHGARDIRIGPHASESRGTDSVEVAVAAVGICGSDLHYYKDGGIGTAVIKQPFVPGHEFSATLIDDCEARGLTRGQLVAVDPATPCHTCEWCARGYHNLCPNVKFIGGPPHHGAMTQTLSVPNSSLIALPANMTADQAAMLEPLGVCIHAIDLAKPRLLESVAIVGCGPIGLGILQLIHQHGCGAVYAIDPQAHRSALASEFGATAVGGNIDVIHDATDGRGCDLVIEATNSPDGFAHAIKATAIGGRAVIVGIPDGDRYNLSAAEARRRGLTVKFSRRMGDVYPRAIELVEHQRVDVDALVSHHFTLDEVPQAFAMQADEVDGLIKSIVYPSTATT